MRHEDLTLIPEADYEWRISHGKQRCVERRWADQSREDALARLRTDPLPVLTRWQRLKRWWRNP